MTKAPRDHFVRSLAQRRQQIVGDRFQLKTDVDVYNGKNTAQQPMWTRCTASPCCLRRSRVRVTGTSEVIPPLPAFGHSCRPSELPFSLLTILNHSARDPVFEGKVRRTA